MQASDVVFLLPGFLGFERTGNFSQFGDRVAAALRGTLELRLGRPVPVLPIRDLPARALVARQRALLAALADATSALCGVERIHLVGYCLGGLDAYLLSCKQPLDAPRWPEICSERADAARSRIASVVSIASPHLGMALASAKSVGSLTPKKLLRDPESAKALARFLPLLISASWSRLDSNELWHGLTREGRKIAHFAAELGRFQQLLPELTPTAMEELHAKAERIPGIRRASVVALTPPVHRGSSPLFAEFANYAAGGSSMGFDTHQPLIAVARQTLRNALGDPTRLIHSERAEVPSVVDVTSHDGVVNSCRQLMNPSDSNNLLALVIGDHFDLIGYYDRVDAAGPGKERELLTGFLRSGSFFRDDEFFALYRKIGNYIAESAGAAKLVPEVTGVIAQIDPAAPKTKQVRERAARPHDLEE